MKYLLTLILISIFSIGSVAQDRGRHRGKRIYRPIIIRPVYQPIYRPIQRAVKVVVYLDGFGRVLYTNTNFADNLHFSERLIAQAERNARRRDYKGTGYNRKKTIYVYFSY